jgi:ferritin
VANISEVSLGLLNNQIKNELLNSNRYRYIGSYLKRLGFDNIGNFFSVDQVNEEFEHSKLITDYINDRNEQVEAIPVPSGNVQINSLTHLAELYNEFEKATTVSLSAIFKQAFDEGDYMLADFCRELIAKQKVEESESMTFLDKAKMADNDPKTWLIWDANFGD